MDQEIDIRKIIDAIKEYYNSQMGELIVNNSVYKVQQESSAQEITRLRGEVELLTAKLASSGDSDDGDNGKN